jgi:hypothetical protein
VFAKRSLLFALKYGYGDNIAGRFIVLARFMPTERVLN